MTTPQDQLLAIQSLCAGAQLINERGGNCVFLPSLGLEVGPNGVNHDTVFVPYNLLGYGSSRLLFPSQLASGNGRNWTQHRLLGRNWWAPSFKVPRQSSWLDEILAHIRGVA